MSRDLLADAARALREEADGRSPAADATRMRVGASVRRHRERRLFALRASVVLVAAALGSTAWAAATGRLPGLRALTQIVSVRAGGTDQAKAAEDRSTRQLVVDRAVPKVDEAQAPPREPPAEASSEPTPSPRAGVDRAASADRPPAREPPVAPGPASREAAPERPEPPSASTAGDADAAADALYARAHALHFQARDHAAALSAWEAYLRSAPRGRFAVLSHYNRAMCLARLGRTAQAREALRPFADGAYGDYRRAEARALLEAMDKAAP
jgi:hypothetical protein